MNRSSLFKVLGICVMFAALAVSLGIWLRQSRNALPPDARNVTTGRHKSGESLDLAAGPDSQTDRVESGGKPRSRNSKARREALERAIAAQEAVVAEKRTALSNLVKSRLVVVSPATPSEAHGGDGTTLPKGRSEVGGYDDLKKELEVELQNLERMKRKLDE